MKSTSIVIMLAAFLGASAVLAQSTRPAAPGQPQIPQFLEGLSSEDPATRSAAEAKLASLNDADRAAIAAQLRGAAAAQAVLQAISQRGQLDATLITAAFDAAPAEQVLAALSGRLGGGVVPATVSAHWRGMEQGSYRPPSIYPPGGAAGIPPVALPALTVHADNQPFWQVLREMCIRHDLRIACELGPRRIALMPAGEPGTELRYPADIRGPYMTLITRFTRSGLANYSTTPPKITRSLDLAINVWVEPKVRVVRFVDRPGLDTAVDDKGNSLLPTPTGEIKTPPYPAPWASLQAEGSRTPAMAAFTLALRPAGEGTRLASLKGSTRCVIQTRTDVTEVPNPMQAGNATLIKGPRRLMLTRLGQAGSGFSASVREEEERPSPIRPSEQPDRGLLSSASFRLIDESTGREFLANSDPGGGMRVASRYGRYAEIYFPVPPGTPIAHDKLKLICEYSGQTEEITIPFEFRDIPLP